MLSSLTDQRVFERCASLLTYCAPVAPRAVFFYPPPAPTAERRFLERNLADTFFSDHPDFTDRYVLLEGKVETPATLRWAVFACIPGGRNRPYRFLLWKLSFVRAVALAPQKISDFLARLVLGRNAVASPGQAELPVCSFFRWECCLSFHWRETYSWKRNLNFKTWR